jgi:hypothetical protein
MSRIVAIVRGLLRVITKIAMIFFSFVALAYAATWIWFAWQLPDLKTTLQIQPPPCKSNLASPVPANTPLSKWQLAAFAAVESPNGLNPPAIPSLRLLGLLVKAPFLVAIGLHTKPTPPETS